MRGGERERRPAEVGMFIGFIYSSDCLCNNHVGNLDHV